jgi:hypothetical protein
LRSRKPEEQKIRKSEMQKIRKAEEPKNRTAIANSEIEDRDLKLAPFGD